MPATTQWLTVHLMDGCVLKGVASVPQGIQIEETQDRDLVLGPPLHVEQHGQLVALPDEGTLVVKRRVDRYFTIRYVRNQMGTSAEA